MSFFRNLTTNELIAEIEKSAPFVGSDEGWKAHHGENWEQKKAEYIAECNQRKEKILQKLKG